MKFELQDKSLKDVLEDLEKVFEKHRLSISEVAPEFNERLTNMLELIRTQFENADAQIRPKKVFSISMCFASQ